MTASILLIGLILVYGFVLNQFLPDKFHLPANMLASLLAILFGWWQGLNFEAMGMSLHFVLKGIGVAFACSLFIAILVGCVVRFVPARHLTALPQIVRPGKITYETAIRIPLSTALSEEILFRGVLLAVLLQDITTLWGVIVCSIVFGVWHVLPSIRDHSKTSTIPIVGATTLAGMFFCWLRLLANSLIAPWLLHWTVNASALLASHFMRQKVHDIT